MNDTERAALVYTVNTELMRAQGEYGQNPYFFGESSDRIMKHFDRLLTDRTAPGLDELLDSVHPECRVARTIRVYGQWDARITWPLEPISEPHQESIWDTADGTGATRIDAIADAVRQVKGTEGSV